MPPGVIANVPALCSKGVVTLVLNVTALVVVRSPVADSCKLPEALTATVPDASGSVMVRVPLVEAPVISKLFVPGVPDVPAK